MFFDVHVSPLSVSLMRTHVVLFPLHAGANWQVPMMPWGIPQGHKHVHGGEGGRRGSEVGEDERVSEHACVHRHNGLRAHVCSCAREVVGGGDSEVDMREGARMTAMDGDGMTCAQLRVLCHHRLGAVQSGVSGRG